MKLVGISSGGGEPTSWPPHPVCGDGCLTMTGVSAQQTASA